ncbi:SUMO-specific isopeptidase USPL1 isoform X3 [Paramisgurnus dabryanus]|uniref:SUMO-specific isopeptidase USPL1 isoform X3 n=1 Tax=Paramisgurnus dabryanus TaxID=90735 RepID=UPI0031F3EA64
MHMEMSLTGVLELPNASMKSSLDLLYIRAVFECDDKNASPGNCPWCLAKGQTNALRHYSINLEETILLCTSPACLYPLVSRPLEDVRASLSKDGEGCKRKASVLSVVEDLSSPSKRLKDENLDTLSAIEDLSSPSKRLKDENLDTLSAVENLSSPSKCLKDENLDTLSAVEDLSSPSKRLKDENLDTLLSADPESHDLNSCTLSNHTEMLTGDQLMLENSIVSVNGTEKENPEDEPNVDLHLGGEKDGGVSSTQDEIEEVMELDVSELDEAVETSEELVPLHLPLFWKNENNLCWLDTLLAMLVNSRTIREALCRDVKRTDSIIRKFYSTYDKTCAYVEAKEQQWDDKVTRVPASILNEAERRLSALRMSLFKLLQPTLRCEIGQEETPVFALPLLLRSDKWAQDLFQHTVSWEFKCKGCGHSLNDSVEKTLTTLTQILSHWHPLNATHHAQCSNCKRKNQRRKMVLEKLSSVFALHFVEGLPRKDLSKYSFEFQGLHYSVSTVIQYNKLLKHFVTWIRQSNGTWLELDDLKYPRSYTHRRFMVPAKEIHIVFWEVESENKDVSEICPPTPTSVTNTNNKQQHKLSHTAADDSLNSVTVSEDTDHNAASTLDASIGSTTTLLDPFKGLSETDVVTLTLVEENSLTEATKLKSPSIVSASSSDSPSSKKPQRCSSGPKEPNLVTQQIPQPSAKSSVTLETQTLSPLPSINKNQGGLQHLSLLQRHPSFQSTPVRPPAPVPKPKPKPILKCETNEAQPAKPADMYGGFLTKKIPAVPNPGGAGNNPSLVPQQKPVGFQGSGKVSEVLKLAGKKTPSITADNQPMSTTEALRLQLMKKLKAKKKKLAKLNQLLGVAGESAPTPDSTALSSPYSVTSSTVAYDNPEYDQFFAELLTPATTASNLSPDSSGLLDSLSNQNGEATNGGLHASSTIAPVVQEQSLRYPSSTNDSAVNDFMNAIEDFIPSKMEQTAVENTDFNALELFF